MKTKTLLLLLTGYTGILLLPTACSREDATNAPIAEEPVQTVKAPQLPAVPFNYAVEMPLHYQQLLQANPLFDNTPATNPITNDGATLGRVLFYDKGLSVNDRTACASCHHQENAFADTTSFSAGFSGGHTRRNAMQLLFTRFVKQGKMFWDTRAASLEDQVLMPVTDPVEMGMPSIEMLVEKLKKRPYYAALFEKAFGSTAITKERIAQALAQFIRALASFQSTFDRGVDSDFSNLSVIERRGLEKVNAYCGSCHSDRVTIGPGLPPTFLFLETPPQNNGLEQVSTDNGVGDITGIAADKGRFKIPSLRNIELTAPYMHDGRFATLEQVFNHYQSGIQPHPNLPNSLDPGGLHFTETEKNEMLAFLKTLTDRTITTDPKFADPFK